MMSGVSQYSYRLRVLPLLHPFTQAGLSTLMLIPLCSVTHGWWLDSRGMTRPQTTCGAGSRRALLAVTYAGAI